MIVFPPAKVNLGLNITAKREDGFHAIESVFIPIPWTDALEGVITDDQMFNFTSSGLGIPGKNDNNLVVKAFNLLNTSYKLPGIRMHLHKVLPMGAGLGGGSSDAAFALRLMNDLCQLGLSTQSLQDLAAKLGSDCPFFIQPGPAFVSGRGEILEPIQLDLKGWYILIVMPAVSIGTAEAYSWIRPVKPEVPIREIVKHSPETWKDLLMNDFEAPVFERYPEIAAVKNRLYAQGAIYASMSGSGAAVYGLFREKPETSSWKDYLHQTGALG